MADRDGTRGTLPLITSGILLSYRPGDSLASATVSRASTATYAQATTFNGLVSDVMLRYVPGDSLSGATASRGSTATFAGAR